jgi:dTDP-4-dehydrorhamnose reductase
MNLARCAAENGVKTIYISSEYVFDGCSGPFAENRKPNPLSVYGATKLAGEEMVCEVDPRSLIIRTTWLHGEDINRRNFVYQVYDRLARGEEMLVPMDQISTPTSTTMVVQRVLELLRSGQCGTYHVAGHHRLSKFEFARRIAQYCGLTEQLLQPILTADLHQSARRPLDAGLSSLYGETPDYQLERTLDYLDGDTDRRRYSEMQRDELAANARDGLEFKTV